MHFSLALVAVGLAPFVAGHCKITAAKGDLGGAGVALGITANSGNSQADVTVFKGNSGFGQTQAGGAIDPTKDLAAAIKLGGATLPQISAGGAVSMTLHQVNGDGAGPMKCSVDASGTGANFVAMTITTDVPGNNGRSGAANADFPLVANLPANIACAGSAAGQSNLCFVKCQNPAGPFGGVVAVQQAAGGATAATGNAGANTAAAGAGAATGGANTATAAGTNANTAAEGAKGTAVTGGTGKAKGAAAGGTKKAKKGGKKGKKGKRPVFVRW